MDEQTIIELLRKKADALGSQRAVADEFGISLPYLNDVLNGRRKPGPAILKGLGLVKREEYVKA